MTHVNVLGLVKVKVKIHSPCSCRRYKVFIFLSCSACLFATTRILKIGNKMTFNCFFKDPLFYYSKKRFSYILEKVSISVSFFPTVESCIINMTV